MLKIKFNYIIIFIVGLIIVTGCSFKNQDVNSENKIKDKDISENKVEDKVDNLEKDDYQDDNPVKISLYHKENKYIRQDVFKSNLAEFKDIGLFSIILSDEKEIDISSVKNLYNKYKMNYDDFSKYKIGYNIRFTLSDGRILNETILKPKVFSDFSFNPYLYVWLYDDINNSGYYSHLEPSDYNDNTVMSSIKLMATSFSKEIVSNIALTVFTYDTLDDFDSNFNYRGNSSHTMFILREEL